MLTVACWACGGDAEPMEEDDLPFHRCTACGFAFQPDRDAEALRELYDESYFETYEGPGYASDLDQRRHEGAVRLDAIERYSPPPAKLFEVGAAEGVFLEEARQRGYEPSGIEPSDGGARVAREQRGLDVRTAFIEDLDFEPATFEVICAWHVLEHVSTPLAPLERLRDALRPGGLLFIEVPNFESLVAQRKRLQWPALDLKHHVGQYGPRSLTTLIERAGFEVVDLHSIAMFTRMRPVPLTRPAYLPNRLLASARAGAPLVRSTHPWKHELLWAVARRPAQPVSSRTDSQT